MGTLKRALDSPEPESENEEATEEVYEVERILAQADVGGDTLYLVKWKGYDSKECTWEPADNFQEQITIDQWKRQLAQGDTLDALQVARIQQLMDDFEAEQEETRRLEHEQEETKQIKSEEREEREAQIRRAKRQKVLEEQSRKLTSPKTNEKPEPSRIKAATVQKPLGKTQQPTTRDRPAAKRQTNGPDILPASTKPSLTSAKPVSSVTNGGPSSAKQRGRPVLPGQMYESLSHRNNAQKKHARMHDRPPEPVNLMAASDLAVREPAYNLPATRVASVRQQSPLFFAENGSISNTESPLQSPVTAQPKTNVSSSAAVPTPPTNHDRDTSPAQELRNDKVKTRPPKSTYSMMQSRSGREWTWEQVLVQLSLGSRNVGDVRISGLAPWLRKALVDLKVDGIKLPLHFEQRFVVTKDEFAEMSASWPPMVEGRGQVLPYDDTAAICNELEAYLKHYKVAAVFAFPDSNVCRAALVLHSSDDETWRMGPLPDANSPRLRLLVRNRAWRDQPVLPLLPSLGYRPVTEVPSNNQPPIQNHHSQLQTQLPSSPVASTPRARPKSPLYRPEPPIDAPTVVASPDAAVTSPQREAANIGPYESIESADVFDNSTVASPEVTAHNENVPSNPDWSCDLEFASMIPSITSSSSRPLVYIALGVSHSQQADLIKEWAAKSTSPRLIFVEKNTQSEWDEFRPTCNSSSPAMLLFSDEPKFCKLEELGSFLGKYEALSAFRISWDPNAKPIYTATKMFTRGTVMLMTEAAMRRAASAKNLLLWFEKNSKDKSKHWKLMVRPNIRNFLQQQAMQAGEDDKSRQFLEVLTIMHRLSGIVDVTIGANVERLQALQQLKIADKADKSEDFVIPLPQLPEYDSSSEVDPSSTKARDDILLRHFVAWTVSHASNHRRFLVIDDDDRAGRDTTIYDNANHIVFQSSDEFLRTPKRKGSMSVKKQK